MIQVAATGYPKQILLTEGINRLSAA